MDEKEISAGDRENPLTRRERVTLQHLAEDKSLPTGTVTFPFTDIEGSTPLWESRPEAMVGAVQTHTTILHRVIETHGGAIYKSVGDSLQAAFSTASEALRLPSQGNRLYQLPPGMN